jgi:type I restriction enzyme R subunit
VGYAGAAAQRKFDKQAVDLVAHQLREQINALDEKSIAVQEKWQQKAQYSDEKVLRQLSPKTQQDLLRPGPLMQWLDVRGQSDAMRFDMDILAAQTARYTNPEELDALAGHHRESGTSAAASDSGAAAGTTD